MQCVLVLSFMLCLAVSLSSNNIHFPTVSALCESGEKCVSFEECESAIKAWKSKEPLPKSCYFKGKIQYVCCSVNQQEQQPVREPKPAPLPQASSINIRGEESCETLSDLSKDLCIANIIKEMCFSVSGSYKRC